MERHGAEKPPAQSKELLGAEAGTGPGSAPGGAGLCARGPAGQGAGSREQGRSPLPSLLRQIRRMLPLPKLLKGVKRRTVRLRALARECWWVLVVKELPSLQPAPAGDVPRGPIAPRLSPGGERGQGCREPRPTGPLGWPGQDQRTVLLGFCRRLFRLALEALEPAASSVEAEAEMEEEMEWEAATDPPAAGQAPAPHPLPAVTVGCLPSGWGWGWGWGAPLQGLGAWSPCPGGTTATTVLPCAFFGPGNPSLTG